MSNTCVLTPEVHALPCLHDFARGWGWCKLGAVCEIARELFGQVAKGHPYPDVREEFLKLQREITPTDLAKRFCGLSQFEYAEPMQSTGGTVTRSGFVQKFHVHTGGGHLMFDADGHYPEFPAEIPDLQPDWYVPSDWAEDVVRAIKEEASSGAWQGGGMHPHYIGRNVLCCCFSLWDRERCKVE